jgi:hypothetical protein
MAGAPGREPSFVWVQGFTDAYRAACVSRGVDLIVPVSIYRQWIGAGDARRGFPAASGWLRSNRPPVSHGATGSCAMGVRIGFAGLTLVPWRHSSRRPPDGR